MAYIHLQSNPFKPQEAEMFCVPGGTTTVRGWLEGHFPGFQEFPNATLCTVNGHAKLRAEWATYTIQEEDIVIFTALPQWVLPVISIILSVASIAYALLMPKPGMPDQSKADSVFSLKGQHNQLKLGEPIESSYGRCRLYPSYAARPYTVFTNNQQYQFNLYSLGHGEFDVEVPHYEDTAVTEFEDVEYAVYGPGETVELFPDNVVTSSAVSALEILGPNEAGYTGFYGPFVCSAPGTVTDYIEADFVFPSGLYKMSDGGKQGWMAISFQIQYQLIDDSGNALGDWTDFLGSMGKDGNTTTAIRWTYPQSVPLGRYQVRVRRITDKDTSASCANTMNWDALRAFLPSTRTYPGITTIAVKARATNNLNDNVANRFNVWATRKLPIWNGTTWSAPTATRNPIWAFCDVFKATYGARLNDQFLRLVRLLSLAGDMQAEGRTFDYTFDQKITVWEAAKLIARSFRGVPIPSGTQVTIARDTLKTIPTAVFTPENIVAGSFQYTINTYMPGEYDSVLVRYTSSETWREETVLCCIGDDAGYAPEDLQLPGITDRVIAWREGMYYRAAKKYKPNAVRFRTGEEGRIPSYLDYILVNHFTPEWGRTAGLVVAIAPDLRTVSLSEPLDFTGVASPVLGLRKKDGTFSGPYPVSVGANSKEVVSSVDITDDFYFDDVHERPFFLFGSAVNYAKGIIVNGLSPSADKQVEITGIEYSELPFANDNANPDDPESVVDPDNGPGVPVFDCSTFKVAWIPQTDTALASWSAAAGARSYVVESSTDGSTWKHEGATSYTSLIIPAILGEFHVRVQALGRAGGSSWCVKDFMDFAPVQQDPVTALTAQSGETYLLRSGDGSMLAQINVTWTLPSTTFADYDGRIEILYKRSTDTVFKTKLLGAGATQYLITPMSDGDVVTIKVRAISYLGVKSAFAQVVHTVTGKVALPGEPTNIALSSVNIPLLNMEATDLFPAAPYYGTRVTWTGATDADLSHYELKATATDSDEATNVVWRSPQNISTDHIEKVFGTEVVLYSIVTGYGGYVRVRSVDTSGNASAWVRCATICDNNYSISGTVSKTQQGSLLGRRSSGSGPVEHVPTDSTFAVSAAGVSVVAQRYTDPADSSTKAIQFRDNNGVTERSVDNGATWQELGGGGASFPAGAVDGQMIVADSTAEGGVRWTGVSVLPAPNTGSGVLVSNGQAWYALSSPIPGSALVLNQAGVPVWATVAGISYDPNAGQPQIAGTTLQCTWQSNGDGNGIFYALGTNLRRQGWANPVTSWPKILGMDSAGNSTTKPAIAADRTNGDMSITTQYNSQVWMAFDLGQRRQMAVTDYTLRFRPAGGTYAPRSWVMEGSNNVAAWTVADIAAATWVTIDERTNDTTIPNTANAYGHFVSQGDSATRFRFIRFRHVLNASNQMSCYVGNIEFYGACTLFQFNIPAGTYSLDYVSNGDGNGLVYYLGSVGLTKPFGNPVWAGDIAWIAEMSPVPANDFPALFDHVVPPSGSYVTAGAWVSTGAGSFVLDLGANRAFSVSRYSIHYAYNSYFPRNWKLQGIESLPGFTLLDANAAVWTDIDVRTADTSINAFGWATLVANGDTTTKFRYLRWLNTGPGSNGDGVFRPSELEFYGTLEVTA